MCYIIRLCTCFNNLLELTIHVVLPHIVINLRIQNYLKTIKTNRMYKIFVLGILRDLMMDMEQDSYLTSNMSHKQALHILRCKSISENNVIFTAK